MKNKKKFFYTIYAGILILAVFFICEYLFSLINLSLIFPPNRQTFYQTPEYSCLAETNNLGFRGKKTHHKKKSKYRIVIIGDSFTYGWGLNFEETWPYLIEKKLKENNINAEVLNLGVPGGNSTIYKKIAQRALPYLKPDLTIIAIEQGGDLAQIKKNLNQENTIKPSLFAKIMPITNLIFFDNKPISGDFYQEVTTTQDIKNFFTNLAKETIEKFDKRLNNPYPISLEIRKLILEGSLNSVLASVAYRDPEIFYHGFNQKDPQTELLINLMAQDLEEIKKLANKYNSKIFVISSPIGIFISDYQFKVIQEQGHRLTPAMLTSTWQDEAIKKACQKSNIDFYEFTKEFRKQDKLTPLFFKYDGHFNTIGASYLASLVEPIISKKLVNK